MKKVLIISYQYPPCASSGVYRLLRFTKALPSKGWYPVVVTVQPQYYPSGMPLNNDMAKEFESLGNHQTVKTKMLAGVEQMTTFLHSHNKRLKPIKPNTVNNKQQHLVTKTRWQALKDFITISLMIPDKQNRWLFHGVKVGRKIIKRNGIDLVYAHGGPWTALVIGAILHKISDIPFVIDFRDPWTDNPYDDLHSSIRRAANNFLEKWCVRSADFVIANTDALHDLFVAKYPMFPADKFMTITNGYDEDDYSHISLQSRLSISTPVTIVHTGTLYSKRSPLPFLTVIAELIESGDIEKKDIKISLVGNIDMPGLKQFLAEKGLEEVVDMPGQISRKDALNKVFSADILLLLQQGTKLQVPGKLFEYIRSGKPIFSICDEGATRDIVLSNKLGIVADANNIDDIRKKFIAFFNKIRDVRRKGSELFTLNKKTIESFSSQAQSEKLASIFNKALSE